MVAPPRRKRLSLPIAPLAAAGIGVLTAAVFALMPTGILESIVIDSGIAAMMPVAEPPLGLTARAVLICAGGGGIALIAWFGLFLLLGTRSIVVQRAGDADADEAAPVLRRADAHPDAPPRRPVFANRDLGTPFLEVRAGRPIHVTAAQPARSVSAPVRDTHVEPAPPTAAVSDVERPIPADLDVPLAAYDPDAIPQKPIDWLPRPASPAPTPGRQVFDPGERFETFELTPTIPPVVAPARTPLPESTALAESAPESGFACAPELDAESGQKPWPVPSPSAMPVSRSAPLPIAAEAPVPLPVSHPERRAPTERRVLTERRAPIERPDPSATIHALLDRLERSVARHESPPPPPAPPPRQESLEEALVTLRRLASRG